MLILKCQLGTRSSSVGRQRAGSNFSTLVLHVLAWGLQFEMLHLVGLLINQWSFWVTLLAIVIATCWMMYRNYVSTRRKVGFVDSSTMSCVCSYHNYFQSNDGVEGPRKDISSDTASLNPVPAGMSVRVFYATQTGTAKVNSTVLLATLHDVIMTELWCWLYCVCTGVCRRTSQRARVAGCGLYCQ